MVELRQGDGGCGSLSDEHAQVSVIDDEEMVDSITSYNIFEACDWESMFVMVDQMPEIPFV